MSTWMVGYILVTLAFGGLALGVGTFVMAPRPNVKSLKH